MAQVTLIAIDPAVQRVLQQDDAGFEGRYHARLGENADLIREIADQTRQMLAAAPRDLPWGGYLAVDKESSLVVGTCAFKTGPRDDGSIEIAYFTFPAFEGRGFATVMARELLKIARDWPQVRSVIAHTLPERNASTRVLEKVGMHCVGEVIDPEDGRVWRWACENS
jgi:[ribosomal protein S5]-alanine N-acetyltransferase